MSCVFFFLEFGILAGETVIATSWLLVVLLKLYGIETDSNQTSL